MNRNIEVVPARGSPADWSRVRSFPGHPEIWLDGLNLGVSQVASRQGVSIRGVVQVGANLGQELEEFPAGVPLLLLEPHPEVFPRLLERVRGRPQVDARELAVGDHVGQADFHLTAFHQQSSLRQPRGENKQAPRLSRVKMTTLDALLSEQALAGTYNVLVVDTQGSEDAVLAGAKSTLTGFDLVILEMSYGFQLYHDNADGWALEALLTAAGFDLIAMDPIEWMPCLVKDGRGWSPSTAWSLLHHHRLWLFALAQLFSNGRDEYPLVGGTIAALAKVFGWRDGARARDDLRDYLADLERGGYQLAQRHTNAAFVRRSIRRSGP